MEDDKALVKITKRGEEKRKQQETNYELDVDGCWIWQGGLSKDGYGKVKREGKTIRAHRLFYQLHKGPINEGMVIMHSCDKPTCVNPEHLSMGTHLDNELDKDIKGRRSPSPTISHPENVPRGENHPRYGKGMPEHIAEALLKANVGRPLTEEHRRKYNIFNDDRVREIRKDDRSSYKIAKELGTTPRTIEKIKKGISYEYVT